MTSTPRPRARDLGIRIGRLPTGPHNAITDVADVRVGQVTMISGEGDLVRGEGPVRTGVTVIVPHGGDLGIDPLYAGYHQLNGNGEMTGIAWLEESGLLTTPVAITNTHSVGVVRDALVEWSVHHGILAENATFSLPVVGETYDGYLNDINGFHVTRDHLFAAMEGATTGPVAEGNVGGGTGMIAHGFKGGIGTSSRQVPEGFGGYTVGALVQANYGQRHLLQIDGVPVGEEIGPDEVPVPWRRPWSPEAGAGSIIVVIATDAPLIPTQCKRLAQRSTVAIGRMGGLGENSSGDLFLAFSTGNRGIDRPGSAEPSVVRSYPNELISILFEAASEAVQEAIVNAMCAATTMSGRDGHIVHELPHDRLREVMARYGRLDRPSPIL